MRYKLFLLAIILLLNLNLKAQIIKTDNDLYKKIDELPFHTIPITSIYTMKQIYTNDVLGYFGSYISGKYDTKLKQDLFLRSPEYQDLKDSLLRIKLSLSNSFYITKIKSLDAYDNSYIKNYEQYDLNKNLKSVVIYTSEVVQGTGNNHKDKIFGSFYFPNIFYRTATYLLQGTFTYNLQIRMIDIPMGVNDALTYDEKKLEVYVVYRIDDFVNGEYIKSNYSKLLVTSKNEIIYAKEFPSNLSNKPRPEQSENIIAREQSRKDKVLLPFIGTKYFNHMGGSGTESSLTITKDGKAIIKSYSAGVHGKTFLDYNGVFKSIIKTKDRVIYYIKGKTISILEENGRIQKGCMNEEEPCTTEFYTNE